MKNKLYYIFGLFMCFIFINGVYAEGISVLLEGNVNGIVKGETAEINVKLTSDKVISNCQFKIESTEGIVFVSNGDIALNNWSKTGTLTDGFTLTRPNNENPNTPNENILKLNYTINDSGTVTIKDIKCVVEEDSSEQILENKEISITAIDAADDTTLKSLRVIEGTDIDFKPDQFQYGTIIETNTFGLEIVTNNPDYQDKVVVKDISGTIINDIKNITFNDLSGQAQMPLTIVVNGNEEKAYILSVKREQRELDNSLEYIKINGSNLSLEDGKDEYNLDVLDDVTDVEVIIALKDSMNFKIGKNSNIDSETLRGIFSITDTIDINIFVEPKDASLGTTSRTYTIHIKKKGVEVKPEEPEKKPVVERPDDDDENNVETNPTTGDISMFVMLLILISSLIVSVVLYRKNLESYK